jgi:predicted membrane channel-forming protein YqfA (hemolysin III family)
MWLLVGGVAFGVVPLAHVLSTCKSWQCASLVGEAGAGMFLCYGIGFFFFSSKVPERWAPGWFDTRLSSHQLWHVFVWAAGAAWLEGMLRHHAWAVSDAPGGGTCVGLQ